MASSSFWSQSARPDAAIVEDVARLLLAAERPVILAGRGAVDAGPVLRELANAVGALLVTTLPTTGLFYGDAFSVEYSGAYATATTRELLGSADVVFALGASLNAYTTMDGRLYDEATVIHCDVDESAIGQQHHANIAMVGDAREVAEALVVVVEGSRRHDDGFRTQDVRERIAASRRARDVAVMNGPGGVDPRAFLRALDDAILDPRRMVIDIGHFSTFPCQCLTARFAGQLILAFGFGAIGLALPTAIGVALARPGEVTLAVVGDGGLLMSLTELETCARLRPRLVLAVMNDHAYSAEVHHLRGHGLPTDIAIFEPTDFALLARNMGMRGITISMPDQLGGLAKMVAEDDGPLVIDVQINPEVVADKFQQATVEARPVVEAAGTQALSRQVDRDAQKSPH